MTTPAPAPAPETTEGSVSALSTFGAPISIARAIPYGIQHVLAMFVANLAPITILCAAAGFDEAQTALLMQNAMVVAGIGTLVQLFSVWRVGSKLPIVMGVSFTFITVLCGIAATYGYPTVVGAVIAGGVCEGILGLFAKYWRRFIKPIVSGVVVTSIGFSLLSVGAASFAGGTGAPDFASPENLFLGTFSLTACLVFQGVMKGPKKQLSVLFGLAAGYVVALFMGNVDFSAFNGISAFSVPAILPYAPEFNLGAIVSVVLLYLVSAAETIGDTAAVTSVGFKREPTEREYQGSIAADGFTSALAGVFGCSPLTSFAQNIGLIAMTHVINRRAVACGAAVLILAGCVPFVGTVFASLPNAVLGGCTIMMFGSIIVSGFQMIAGAGFSQKNITVAAISLAIGIGFSQVTGIFVNFPPLLQSVFAGNSVALVFLVAVVLANALPEDTVIRTAFKIEKK
ncbi:MAG: purine permease [Denitrobacterium sp.]|nr:purine permease [Denitrobacterium sp.]